MISSKFFALALLLVCPLALARVHVSANIEMNNSQQQSRTISTEVALDANEGAVVFDDNTMHIETVLLDQQDNEAHVRYAISIPNAEGNYEIIAAPELCAVYGEVATVSLGNTNGDTLIMAVKATKI